MEWISGCVEQDVFKHGFDIRPVCGPDAPALSVRKIPAGTADGLRMVVLSVYLYCYVISFVPFVCSCYFFYLMSSLSFVLFIRTAGPGILQSSAAPRLPALLP